LINILYFTSTMDDLKIYDVIIIGAGSAGIAAANYFTKN
jgi:cation diffusion facilitator CzcD-associated flavoprotein CzcO